LTIQKRRPGPVKYAEFRCPGWGCTWRVFVPFEARPGREPRILSLGDDEATPPNVIPEHLLTTVKQHLKVCIVPRLGSANDKPTPSTFCSLLQAMEVSVELVPAWFAARAVSSTGTTSIEGTDNT
jgi:hypothetical protein